MYTPKINLYLNEVISLIISSFLSCKIESISMLFILAHGCTETLCTHLKQSSTSKFLAFFEISLSNTPYPQAS